MNVELIDKMGSDKSIVNAARVSFSKDADNYTDEQNQSLIRYLAKGMSHKNYQQLVSDVAHGLMTQKAAETLLEQYRNTPSHWSPFSHAILSFRVSAPTSIRTQCFKHKQGLTENEESRRYISTIPTLFVPEDFRLSPENAKQGSGDVHPDSKFWKDEYTRQCMEAINLYEDMINAEVAPEQARFVLPQGVEVNWIWTGSLYAFANFYNKRTDPHAQKEIQDLAHKFGELIAPLFPVSWQALTGVQYIDEQSRESE